MKEKTETKNIYLNIVDGDLVHTFTITEKEFAEKYAGYEVLEEGEGYKILKAK